MIVINKSAKRSMPYGGPQKPMDIDA